MEFIYIKKLKMSDLIERSVKLFSDLSKKKVDSLTQNGFHATNYFNNNGWF